MMQHPGQHLFDYFNKEEVMQTWSAEMYGYAVVGHFTSHLIWEQLIWTADIDRLKGKVGRRQVRHIRNDMDEVYEEMLHLQGVWAHLQEMPYEKSTG